MEQLRTEIKTGNEVINNQFEGASNLMNDMYGDINGCNLHLPDEETENKEDVNAADTVMNTRIIDEIYHKFDGIEEQQERLQEMIRKLPAEDLRQLEAILRLDDRHLRVNLIQFHRRSTRNAFFEIESDCIMDEIMEIFYHQMKKHFDKMYLADNDVRDDKIDLADHSERDDKINLANNVGRDDNIDSKRHRVMQSLDLIQEAAEFTHSGSNGATTQHSLSKTKMTHKGANSVLVQIRNLRSRILNAFIGTKTDKSSVKQPKARKEKRKRFSCFAF